MSDARPTATSNRHKAAGNWAGKVSQALRKGGLMPTGASNPSSREALRVKSGEVGKCTVIADIDHHGHAVDVIEQAEAVLKRAGYTVARADIDDMPRLIVTQGAIPSTDWKKRKDLMNHWTYENRRYPGWVIDITETEYVARKGRRDEGQPFATLAAATTYIEGQAS